MSSIRRFVWKMKKKMAAADSPLFPTEADDRGRWQTRFKHIFLLRLLPSPSRVLSYVVGDATHFFVSFRVRDPGDLF